MEDAHAAILDLNAAPPASATVEGEPEIPEKNSFFAVYDGHGGL